MRSAAEFDRLLGWVGLLLLPLNLKKKCKLFSNYHVVNKSHMAGRPCKIKVELHLRCVLPFFF